MWRQLFLTCALLANVCCSNSPSTEIESPNPPAVLTTTQIDEYEQLGAAGMGWAYAQLEFNSQWHGNQAQVDRYHFLALSNGDSMTSFIYAQFLLHQTQSMADIDPLKSILTEEAVRRLDIAVVNAFEYPNSSNTPEYGRRILERIRVERLRVTGLPRGLP